MANDVKVVIELLKAAPRAGFGYPLILEVGGEAEVKYTEVGSLDEVAKAGFAAETATYKAAQLLFMQANAPSKIAVCGSTGDAVTALPKILNEGWRQLIIVNGTVDVEAVSDYIESCGKHAVFFASVNSESSDSVIQAVSGNERTFLLAHKGETVANPEAAVVGATAGLDAGSFTYKNIALKGVTAQSYTDAEVEALHAKNVNTVLLKAGSVVTSEGLTVSGEYADIVDTKDYLIQQIEYQCQHLLNRVPKLPYDNRGIAALEGVVLSVLKDAANNGMIAVNDEGDYEYSVNFAPRSECAPADISSRHYAEGKFEFTLAGAIHTAKIKGTILA